VQEMINKTKAEGRATGGNFVFLTPGAEAGHAAFSEGIVTREGKVMVSKMAPGKGEDLGKKSIEGVMATGSRNVQTIETGEIGNDRPIQVVNERWYSEELGTMLMTKRTDPRTGDESFRLTNIRRGDPASYLFQPPADAHITTERKM
jgi:hypothetical protein